MPPDFTNSHRMAWFCLVSIVGLTGLGMMFGIDGMGNAVGMACVALAGLAGGYSHVTNKRETESEKKT